MQQDQDEHQDQAEEYEALPAPPTRAAQQRTWRQEALFELEDWDELHEGQALPEVRL
ncbi:hypothetical protein OG897_08530 [Streptomyces sp. NBC_00237]|uniref:hypothetical protein n=1 Tax=Streptomyces sp. NBC_00237 TaxID=2975687 RepID=UPI002254B213|nr:hypothetical protein [Streptomyces sp. NBC_00237]MCX5201497.1 hypothetical protein [Streptomyces sp. NBC_00237]